MRKYLLALPIAFVLSSCAAMAAIEKVKLSSNQVYAIINSYDVAVISATQYLKLPGKCTPTVRVCRNKRVTRIIVPAVRKGRVARNTLRQNCLESANSRSCINAFQILTTSVKAIQSVQP